MFYDDVKKKLRNYYSLPLLLVHTALRNRTRMECARSIDPLWMANHQIHTIYHHPQKLFNITLLRTRFVV